MAWTNMGTKLNNTVVDSTDWNQLVANNAYMGGADGQTHTGDWNCSGTGYFAGGWLSVSSGGAGMAGSGIIRLPNAQSVSWRNGGGTGDIGIQADSANRLVFSGAGGSWNTSTSVGAAGGASALPATPLGYLVSVVNGNSCRFPFYA